MIEQALANWPVLKSTEGAGPQPRTHPKLCKLHGPPLPGNEVYYRGQCSGLEEPDTDSYSSKEWVHEEWFDPDEDLACYTGYDD